MAEAVAVAELGDCLAVGTRKGDEEIVESLWELLLGAEEDVGRALWLGLVSWKGLRRVGPETSGEEEWERSKKRMGGGTAEQGNGWRNDHGVVMSLCPYVTTSWSCDGKARTSRGALIWRMMWDGWQLRKYK
jgi:hypothetical protein